jgi:hypothetical protein
MSDMQPSVPLYDHIVVVIEENHSASEIAAYAPYISSLITGGASLTNYSALTHPSQPNYFALYAGDTMGIADNRNHSYSDVPTLATALQDAGKNFTGYIEEGSPRKHNPWESFGEYSVEQRMSNFPTDYSQLPTVSFVIPNLNNDMHDGSVSQGDTWLRQNLSAYTHWAKNNNSLLVVTTDEDDLSGSNQVMTVLNGAHVVPGTYTQSANHYSLLKTIAAAAGVRAPGKAATASPLMGMFDTPSIPPPVSPPHHSSP